MDISTISLEKRKELCAYLANMMTEERARKFNYVLSERTRHITLVLEDVFQSHNASAILRSCECFGIQDVHFIENDFEYQINEDIALGSFKWLSIERHRSTIFTIENLRSQGYQIAVTALHEDKSIPLEKLDVSKKTAILFGTELLGLSKEAINNSDVIVHIPMMGFTESLNLSVSAAIVSNILTKKIRDNNISWQLSDEEKTNLLIEWSMKTVKDSKRIVQKWVDSNII